MKRRALIRTIAAEARRQRVDWQLERQGARHTIYSLGGVMIPIPRHTELGERTAELILKECEPMLGARWWR